MSLKKVEQLSPGIKTPVISSLVRAYELWYGDSTRRCGCGPTTGTWPNNFIRQPNGLELPAVCPLHEWQHKQNILQLHLVEQGISMPIPRQWSQSDTADNVLDMLTGTGNPLSLIKGPMNVKGATFSEIGAIAGKLARNWAKFPQAEGEHVVTLTNKTQVLTMMYERQDQAVKDVLLYSPVLVYWDNIDKRDNGEYISYLIQSRQKGITIVNE